jgi:hypothetical protein
MKEIIYTITATLVLLASVSKGSKTTCISNGDKDYTVFWSTSDTDDTSAKLIIEFTGVGGSPCSCYNISNDDLSASYIQDNKFYVPLNTSADSVDFLQDVVAFYDVNTVDCSGDTLISDTSTSFHSVNATDFTYEFFYKLSTEINCSDSYIRVNSSVDNTIEGCAWTTNSSVKNSTNLTALDTDIIIKRDLIFWGGFTSPLVCKSGDDDNTCDCWGQYRPIEVKENEDVTISLRICILDCVTEKLNYSHYDVYDATVNISTHDDLPVASQSVFHIPYDSGACLVNDSLALNFTVPGLNDECDDWPCEATLTFSINNTFLVAGNRRLETSNTEFQKQQSYSFSVYPKSRPVLKNKIYNNMVVSLSVRADAVSKISATMGEIEEYVQRSVQYVTGSKLLNSYGDLSKTFFVVLKTTESSEWINEKILSSPHLSNIVNAETIQSKILEAGIDGKDNTRGTRDLEAKRLIVPIGSCFILILVGYVVWYKRKSIPRKIVKVLPEHTHEVKEKPKAECNDSASSDTNSSREQQMESEQ